MLSCSRSGTLDRARVLMERGRPGASRINASLHAANFSKMKGGRGFDVLLTPARAGRIPSHIILFGRS